MTILLYEQAKDQANWLAQLARCDWGAGQYLHALLAENRLQALCGPHTRTLLLTQDKTLLGFCTLADQDEIHPTPLTPWIGFVYVFPEARGKRLSGLLLA